MTQGRTTQIVIMEHHPDASTIKVDADGPVAFAIQFKPTEFENPKVAHLEAVVASQRTEIEKLNAKKPRRRR